MFVTQVYNTKTPDSAHADCYMLSASCFPLPHHLRHCHELEAYRLVARNQQIRGFDGVSAVGAHRFLVAVVH